MSRDADSLLTDCGNVHDRVGGTSAETRRKRGGSSRRDHDGGGRGFRRASPSSSIDRVGEESEDDSGESGHGSSDESERFGMRERESLGDESERGSGRARAREKKRAVGLEGLNRQVWLVFVLICIFHGLNAYLAHWSFSETLRGPSVLCGGRGSFAAICLVLSKSLGRPFDSFAAVDFVFGEGTPIDGEGDEWSCQGQPIQRCHHQRAS